jgi:hypothetical protein
MDPLKSLTVAIDFLLRRIRGIREFSGDPQCIYRLSLGVARREMLLPDGSRIRRGTPVGHLHLWSEHMPPIPSSGADLAWANRTLRAVRRSLILLAEYVCGDPRLARVAAFGADNYFVVAPAADRVLRRIGFAVEEDPLPQNRPALIALAVARYWAWLLRRAFNPQSAAGLRPRDLHRRRIWLMRGLLLERYGSGKETQSPGLRISRTS